MIKIIWNNTKTNRHGEIIADSLESANVDQYINSNAWGKPKYWVDKEPENYIATREGKDGIEYLIPCEYTYEIIDITEEYNKQKDIEENIIQGRLYKSVCDDCLDYVRAYNVKNGLTTESINMFKSTFGTCKEYLQDGQPFAAIAEINKINNEKYLDLKEALLTILNKVK